MNIRVLRLVDKFKVLVTLVNLVNCSEYRYRVVFPLLELLEQKFVVLAGLVGSHKVADKCSIDV